jgi:hypothetical protein
LYPQKVRFDKNNLEAVNVSMSIERLKGEDVVKVIKDSNVKEFDEPTFVKIRGIKFTNGTIEAMVLSRLLKNAPESARGFIGIAFRVNDSSSRFESIYLRPANARAENQGRRNHSIQYFAYPDYKFERLRKESPEQYESYTDMELNEWIRMRIEVRGNHAQLFINNYKQPSLIVNDLKHGPNESGAIGLWVDIGTEGFFTDLKISKE